MLEVKHLSKKFGDLEVLKDISFSLSQSEILTIIGPSGTGKSTLLRFINYLEKPEEGTIEINNLKFDFTDMDREKILNLRKQTSMVFQNYNLFKNKNVIENVMEALLVVKKKSKKEAYDIAMKNLALVGLLDKKDEYPSRLSGGQQQRVGIARAMAVEPKIILFDEPTSSLDPFLVNEVLDTIKELAKTKVSMIIVTHEMEFARQVSDKVIFLNDGIICEEGTPDKIFSNPDNELTKRFISSAMRK